MLVPLVLPFLRAIQASLSPDCDAELLAVVQLSQLQQDEEERRQKLEEETLDQVLKLSLKEKWLYFIGM